MFDLCFLPSSDDVGSEFSFLVLALALAGRFLNNDRIVRVS